MSTNSTPLAPTSLPKPKFSILRSTALLPPCWPEDFTTLPLYAQTAETLLYYTRALEFWVSPGGRLRLWLQLNLLLLFIVVIPLALLLPPLAGAAELLCAMLTSLALAMQALLNALLYALASLLVIFVLLLLLRR